VAQFDTFHSFGTVATKLRKLAKLKSTRQSNERKELKENFLPYLTISTAFPTLSGDVFVAAEMNIKAIWSH
jgi:hypothetical protein